MLRNLLLKQGWQESDFNSLLSELITGKNYNKLSAADQAMLDYARKLTLTPGEINLDDINLLHEVGFDDRAIHDICAIAAYFAFGNRIADGLGVELEPRFMTSE